MSVDLKAIEAEWLNQCGPCDYGMVEYGCQCSNGDPRPVVASLVREVETLRAREAELWLLLGLIQQACDFGHVHELLDEFRKAPDFPVGPPSAVPPSPAGGEARSEQP